MGSSLISVCRSFAVHCQPVCRRDYGEPVAAISISAEHNARKHNSSGRRSAVVRVGDDSNRRSDVCNSGRVHRSARKGNHCRYRRRLSYRARSTLCWPGVWRLDESCAVACAGNRVRSLRRVVDLSCSSCDGRLYRRTGLRLCARTRLLLKLNFGAPRRSIVVREGWESALQR